MRQDVNPTKQSHLLGGEFKGDVISTVQNYMQAGAFTDRKLTDTPIDALSVVNKKFVTANGVSGSRPSSPVIGQFYFDTTIGLPIWYNGTDWIDGAGNVV